MIPEELRRLPQWVVAGSNKLPLNPRTKRAASVTDPSTWGTYDEAVGAGMPHVGFVLTKEDPYTIIDLDDPETPEQRDRHRQIYESIDSYAEVSQSGKGVHIICRGKVPRGIRRDKVEIYSHARYMICTGRALRDSPIREMQWLLDIIYEEMSRDGALVATGGDIPDREETLDDETVFRMAANAVNGDKFAKLCRGEWQSDYPSQSEADYALLAILAFYTRNNEQVMRLFRYSALGKRDKAQRDSYLLTALRKIRAKQPELIDFSQLHLPNPTPTPVAEQSLHTTPSVEEFQRGVDYPPGLVGEMARYIFDSATRPVKEIAICAALALCAGVAGRQFNVSNTGLNQYLILLAKTGVGKEEAARGIDRILSSVRDTIPVVDQFIGPGTFASGQAIIRTLDERPCFVSILGEFGLMLQELSDSGNPQPHMRQYRRVILDAYGKSGYGNFLRSSAYADREKNTKTVHSPALTMFGESTPETFYAGLSLSQIADGLIPRFLVVEYTGDRPQRNQNAFFAPPEELAKRFGALVSTVLQMQANEMFAPVGLSDAAQSLMDEFDDFCDEHLRAGSSEGVRQLWNRAHLKALRLAALLAAADRPHQPVIGQAEALWAIELVSKDTLAMIRKFETGEVGEGEVKQLSDLERILQEYLEKPVEEIEKYRVDIRMRDDRVVPYAYLQRRTAALAAFRKHRLGARAALKEGIQDLIDADRLVEMDKSQVQERYNSRQTVYFIR